MLESELNAIKCALQALCEQAFMFNLWSQCYCKLLSSTCLPQPLQDLEEGQGVRERKRLAAAARVVWVPVCGRVVCKCYCASFDS